MREKGPLTAMENTLNHALHRTRVIQEHIKKPLADLVLFGALAKGGSAMVTVNEERSGLSIEALVETDEPVEA